MPNIRINAPIKFSGEAPGIFSDPRGDIAQGKYKLPSLEQFAQDNGLNPADVKTALAKLGMPGLQANDSRDLVNFSGQTMTNPVVYPIYVGEHFDTPVGNTHVTELNTYFTKLVQSDYLQLLAPYSAGGSILGSGGSFGGSGKCSYSIYAEPKVIDQNDIQLIIKGMLAENLIPADPNGVYSVILPPGVDLRLGTLSSANKEHGGYHGSFVDGSGKAVRFMAIPWPDEDNGIYIKSRAISHGLSISHELAEICSDPGVNQNPGVVGGERLGWITLDGQEAADVVVNSYALASWLAGNPSLFEDVVAMKQLPDGTSIPVQKLRDQFSGLMRIGLGAMDSFPDPLANWPDIQAAINLKLAPLPPPKTPATSTGTSVPTQQPPSQTSPDPSKLPQ
jgi:hypothetical protein